MATLCSYDYRLCGGGNGPDTRTPQVASGLVWELIVHWGPPLITGPSRRSQKTVNRCYCTPLIKLNQIINQLTTRNQLGVQETGERLIDLQTCWSQKINTSSSASETENVPSVAIKSRYLIIVILGELRLTAQRDQVCRRTRTRRQRTSIEQICTTHNDFIIIIIRSLVQSILK